MEIKKSEIRKMVKQLMEESNGVPLDGGSNWWETLVKFLEQYCANIDPENGEWIDEEKGMADADSFERIFGADPYNAGFINDASEGAIVVSANEADAKVELEIFLQEYVDNINISTGEFIDEEEGSSAAKDFEIVFGADPYNGMFISEDGEILI